MASTRRLAAILAADVAGYSRLTKKERTNELSGAGDHRQARDGAWGSEPVEFSKIHLEPLSNGRQRLTIGQD